MEVAIYYHSTFGNGERVMRMLKDELVGLGYTVSMEKLRRGTRPRSADVHVFSTPTHGGAPVGKMKRFLGSLPVQEGRYALATTYGDGLPQTLNIMDELLADKGMRKVCDMAVPVKGIRDASLDITAAPLVRDFAEKILIDSRSRS
ncbi:MAG: flavodoxin family protein [Candidatus Methanomethylophilaceae archaeon]|jgi:flavodoxin